MKKKLIILGVAALSSTIAVPALALESEFHGMYRLRSMLTNFQSAGLAGITAKGAASTPTQLLSSESRDYTLFEQRARLQYIAKANDDLKLVTHFEVDSTWGDAAYDNGRGKGAGLAGDTVNLETKSVYLDFTLPSTPINMKVGLQGFSDAYKGVFLSDDVAGAVATGKFGPATATAAFLRTYEQGGTTALGKKNVDVYVLDAKLAPSKALTVGASYYLANNDVNYSGQQTHTVGVNAAAKLGMADVDAFFIYQGGDELYAATGKDLSAFAGQVAAKVNAGPAAVRIAGLYATGDHERKADKTTAFQNIFASGAAGAAPGSSTSSGVYYTSSMLLLMRSIFALDSDQALVISTNNGNAGLMAAFVGADINANDKLSLSINAGHVLVEAKQKVTKNSTIGSEINLNVNYKLYPNLIATVQGAYALLGGYTKAGNNKDLKDPYLTSLMLNYTF